MPLKVPTHRPNGTEMGGRRAAQRQYDQTRRDRIAKAFYHTQAWLRLRLVKLAETPYCEDCHARGELTQASHVHHIIEIKDDWSLRLDLDNLRSLCHSCHSRMHAKQVHAWR